MAESDINKIAVSSSDRLLGASTAYGYQTSVWIGRLRLHIFHREDPGAAFHNHPWDFWTFPLTPYVERVINPETGATELRGVSAFRVSFRPAEHAHRILGRWGPRLHPQQRTRVVPGAVVTICWRGRHRRAWEYLNVSGSGLVRRLPWRRYLALADQKPRGISK